MIGSMDDAPKSALELAMERLKQAVAAGFRDIELMKKTRELDPLREREDFKKLIAELEAKR